MSEQMNSSGFDILNKYILKIYLLALDTIAIKNIFFTYNYRYVKRFRNMPKVVSCIVMNICNSKKIVSFIFLYTMFYNANLYFSQSINLL